MKVHKELTYTTKIVWWVFGERLHALDVFDAFSSDAKAYLKLSKFFLGLLLTFHQQVWELLNFVNFVPQISEAYLRHLWWVFLQK